MAPVLSVRCFGDVALAYGDAALPLAMLPKSVLLLALLVRRRDEAIARERLAAQLWPDELGPVARGNLRRHLHSLSAALPERPEGRPWLRASMRTIALDADAPVWYDVAEYERLAADPATLGEAVGLYRGEYLAAFDDEWVVEERRRLAERHVEHLEELVARLRRERNFASAATYASEALRLDPFRETALRALLAVRFEAGDATDALALYERFARTLENELGAAPMPETRALVERIARGEPLAREPLVREPHREERARGAAPRDASDRNALPFVGRERELARLRELWRACADTRGSIAFVRGEAGIGKSRLVAEFAREVERSGGSAIVGTTSPLEAQPYQAVVEALREALPMILEARLDPLALAVLAVVVPELAAHVTIAPPPLDETRERRRLFDTIASTFEALALRRARLLVFEDLQWAGPATLALVEFLARRAANAAFAVIATVRDGEPADATLALRRSLARANGALELELAPLERGDVARLLPSDDALALDGLYRESDGNPFFLSIALAARRDGLPAVRVAADAVARRLDGLGDDARALAETAAVVGHAFDSEVAADSIGWTPARAHAALDELLDRRIVRAAGRIAYAEYTFGHHLFSAHLYANVDERRRASVHRRAARALVRLFPNDGDALAFAIATHFDRAGMRGEAASSYLKAAGRARALAASEEALSAAERAAALAPDAMLRFRAFALVEELHGLRADRAAQASALEALRTAANELGAADAHAETARRTARLANALGWRAAEDDAILDLERAGRAPGGVRWAAECELSRARRAHAAGAMEAAGAHADLALARYDDADDADGALDALTLGAGIAQLLGQPDRAEAALARARALAARFSGPFALMRVLRAASSVTFVSRDFERSERACEELLALCERAGDREGEADVCARYASIRVRRFDLPGAREYFARAQALHERLGNVRALAGIGLNASIADFAAGDVEGALAGLRVAQTRFAELDELRGRSLAASNAALCLVYLRRTAEAIETAREALELARRGVAPSIETQAWANLGTALRVHGDPAASVEAVQRALALRRSSGSQIDLVEDLVDLAQSYLALGRLADAEQTLREFEPHLAPSAERSFFAPELWHGSALVRDALGDATGALTDARRAYETYLERLQTFADPVDRARYAAHGAHPAIAAGFGVVR